jgi:2-polyprenyl-3-methyl-5-hydroxy-6-metoxy-1,4-benzoquinol methylase
MVHWLTEGFLEKMENQHKPSPESIFQAINSYQRTAALKGAIELDVFTAIGEGFATAKELAARCEASERGMRILCDYLAVIGLLSKNGLRYSLTPDAAAFLDRRSPMYIGGITKFLLSPQQMEAFRDVAASVRKGGTAVSPDGVIAPENPIWVDFARCMAPLMMPAAEAIAELTGAGGGHKWKVLDIAAGHGLFGITIAKRNPNAEIVALDWPNVLAVAEENAERAGVGSRFTKLPGSALEIDYGSGYDIVLLTNFLHHFDVSTCESVIRKVHAALKPSGRAVTLEFVPNEDRISPPIPASFAMMMLNLTPSGDAYTFPELERMFRNAGFSRSEIHPLEKSPEQVILSYK